MCGLRLNVLVCLEVFAEGPAGGAFQAVALDHEVRQARAGKQGLLRHPGKLELRDPTDQDPYYQGTVAQIRLPLWALEPPPKVGDGNLKKEDEGLERL